MTKFTHTFSVVATTAVAATLFLFSCDESEKQTGPDIGVRDSMPVLRSIGVSTLISDSGIIRYKLIAEEWYIYDKTVPPHWSFEKGLFVERFNPSFQVDAFISCDTAYFYNQQELWELRGRVLVKNLKNETFKTTLLFWDQRAHRIYSSAYMEIDGETQKLSGYNFSSNEQMTDYIIHSSKGQFPLEDHTPPPQPDPEIMAQQQDSTQQE